MITNLPEPDIKSYLKRYAYVVSDDAVMDLDARPEDALMSMTAFKNLTAGATFTIVGPKGGEKNVKLSDLWIKHPERLNLASIEYAPGMGRVYTDENGVPRYNSFSLPAHADTSIHDPNVNILNEHLTFLIPDAVERKMFIHFLAHMIQYPQDRPTIVPLIIAREHGTGRGWITELMVAVLGLWNCGTSKMGQLAGEGSAGQYQNALVKTLLTTIHETKVKEKSWTVDDQVRDLLTEQHLQLNTKYGSFDVQRVFTRFLLYSNHVDAVRIPPEDRRIWVLRVETDPSDEKYYKRIYDWLKGDGPAHVYWYLKGVDLTGFNSGMRAPMTPAKEAMITETQTSCETLILDSLELLPAGVDLATWKQVQSLTLSAQASGISEVEVHDRPSALRKALNGIAETLSTGTKDNKIRWNGKPVRVYVLRNKNDWRGKVDTDVVRKQLDMLQERLDLPTEGIKEIVFPDVK